MGLTVSVCTLFLGIGSEFLQAFVTTRVFDLVDILANLLGSGLAVMLSTWYHRRMLERKLEKKRMATMGAYTPVAGEEEEGVVEFDQELGEIDTNEDAEAQTWK